MTCALPDPQQVLKGVEIYLGHAYTAGPPQAICKLVEDLKSDAPRLFESAAFQKIGDAEHTTFILRLGNSQYPHMKLVLEPSPDGATHLFRADAHDKHICPPPGHPEYDAFTALRSCNKKLTEEIEQDWETQGIATYKTYLQQRLAQFEQTIDAAP